MVVVFKWVISWKTSTWKTKMETEGKTKIDLRKKAYKEKWRMKFI
jgi:hypothetical protein